MAASRLSLALADGALALPPGRIAIFCAPPGYDLSALPKDRVTLVSHDAVATAWWQTAGFDVTRRAEGDYAAALVVLPRAKEAAKALIAQAAELAPLALVDGQKHDGVDSILKAVRAETPVVGALAKAHGKLFWVENAAFPDWTARTHEVGGFVTRPGVFSADGPDKGSLALADALPPLRGAVADLGAGWGFLARHILAAEAVTELHLVEADAVALECAKLNVPDPRTRFHWADATTWQPPAPLDAVVSNPPFHAGRAGDPGLGKAFIAAAARMLAPTGSFWMVANRHLPYEAELDADFARIEEVGGTPGFKVIHAQRPHRHRR